MPKFFNKKTATVRFHGFNEEKKYQKVHVVNRCPIEEAIHNSHPHLTNQSIPRVLENNQINN